MISFVKKLARSVYYKGRFPKSQVAFGAKVSRSCTLEPGVRIFNGCNVGDCELKRYSYLGDRCVFARTIVGPFTSVGAEVLCGLGSHPIHYGSTYPGFYSNHSAGAEWFGSIQEYSDKKQVRIGADVWIGSRAIILGGLTIGDGAVIGAGAVVTKDVRPFSVVAGVPAKILKYRFDARIQELILASQWWELNENQLRQISHCVQSPEEFATEALKLKPEPKGRESMVGTGHPQTTYCGPVAAKTLL